MHPTGLYPEQDPARDRHPQATLYASLELSRSVWLVTSLAPGGGKMSKHSVAAGDGAALLALLARLRGRVERSAGGLVATQGVYDFEPLGKDRRAGLEALRTGDGRPLPARLKAELRREVERLELVQRQIAEVEAERDAAEPGAEPSPVALLKGLKGIGPQFAAVLYHEGLYRTFANRREVAAYAGLAPTPWRSGKVAREQGTSKAGDPRLRHAMVELAWLWVRHQPDSAPSRWFRARVGHERGRVRRVAIVALARRLLVTPWTMLQEA